jgi:tRNA-Thr(GGU) m(6)t(6)A37 methyltransferase TsaA
MRLKPIGIIHSPFQQATGTPIQPRFSDGAEGSVEIFSEFIPGLKDLAGFDRIWLLYWFHWARFEKCGLVVTPYLDDTPRGVFATRAPARPNPIGLSAVRLLEVRGNTLSIRDVDILEGTPLLDIKPYFPQFDCFKVARSGWLQGSALRRAKADDRFEAKKAKAPPSQTARRPSASGRLALHRHPGSKS